MTATAQDSAQSSSAQDPARLSTAQDPARLGTAQDPARSGPVSGRTASGGEERGPRRPSLSPSRAADFKTCPLLYRFRTIDRLPERRSPAAVRGTLVHAVLERLYDLPACERTAEAARELVAPAWEELRADPEVAALFTSDGAAGGAPGAAAPDGPSPEVPAAEVTSLEEWLASAGELVQTYFSLEDPSRIEPHGREELVEVTLPDGLLLRGYVDRLDVAPNGALRVVDYKTGSVPREAFEGKALFQMKFYALVLWRTRGVVASQLKLLYLGNGDALTYSPDEAELVRFERTLQAIWAAIERAVATGDFRPNRTRLCGWCDHQALCPSFGGTPPPFPAEAAAAAGWATLPVVDRD
ncbi:RecB family exonuclease [Geodermatophilus pulveris]|nr:PD-(D/E)XK nuclease family protein [Geodermatophilus pulveris]